MEKSPTVPRRSSATAVPPHLLGFLDERLKTREDLLRLRSIVSYLEEGCADLEAGLCGLEQRLLRALSSWISRSGEVRKALHRLDLTREGCAAEVGMRGVRRMVDEELPLLVREVGRIETVWLYAETTLHLEALVGDLEDAVLSIINETSESKLSFGLSKASCETDSNCKHEKLLLAINAMKAIEKILANIGNTRPRWINLLTVVDSRVEKALSFLRPQVLTDHRALLASLGWPPPLATPNIEKEMCLDIPNPLVLMQGDKKEQYSRSFLALCALQHLHSQREERKIHFPTNQQVYKLSRTTNLDFRQWVFSFLWTIDELVYPIALRMECHFSRWSEEPKFIFALVYKVTRDFLDGVDNVLQPLIDEGRLVGYSAKEAWVSAMVKMLSKYLAREIFPRLVKIHEDSHRRMESTSSWLHLIDIMLSFDKRMQALASLGTTHMETIAGFEGFSQSLLIMSIFNEHHDWLQIWAQTELKDAEDKLRSELEDEISWRTHATKQGEFSYEDKVEAFLLSTREDYKAPLIADSVVRMSWTMVERGKSLPGPSLKILFLRSSVTIFLNDFFVDLVHRHEEIQSTAHINEDDALLRIVGLVNAARYLESVMEGWSEDLTFLEMSAAGNDGLKSTKMGQHPNNGFFRDEIRYLGNLGTDYLVEIVSALLLEFEALSCGYIQNTNRWQQKLEEHKDHISDEENLVASPELLEALDMLKDQTGIFKNDLNAKDFLDLWRSIAGGLDHFIFNSIPLSQVKFSCCGANQFKADMRALFLVFKPFCARPDAFLPCTADSLKLLAMQRKDVNFLLKLLSHDDKGTDKCLRLRGLYHISALQTVKILRNMIFDLDQEAMK